MISIMRKYPEIIDDFYIDNKQAKEILLKHSFHVADKALEINLKKSLNLDERYIFEASLLHDIGMIKTNAPNLCCFGDKPYLWHGVLGAEMLNGTKYEKYQDICKDHFGVGLNKQEVINLQIGTEAMEPTTIEEKLIAYADNFFSKKYIEKIDVELSLDDIVNNLNRFGADKVEKFWEFYKIFS